MGLLAKLVGVSIKQGVLMAIIAALPMWWWSYAGLTEADLENPAKFAEASVMMSLGLVLFVGGLAYRGLPFDLIPDWIPLFGKLDDLAAGGVAGAGCAMMYFGWHYGTGPKPTEAIAVANALAVANAHLAPAKKAAIAAIKAFYAVAKPIVQQLAPHVEKVYSEKALPLINAARAKIMSGAYEEYLLQLAANNPGFFGKLLGAKAA